jgi:hypothetical protein
MASRFPPRNDRGAPSGLFSFNDLASLAGPACWSESEPNLRRPVTALQFGLAQETVSVYIEPPEYRLDIRVCAQGLFEFIEADLAIAVQVYGVKIQRRNRGIFWCCGLLRFSRGEMPSLSESMSRIACTAMLCTNSS